MYSQGFKEQFKLMYDFIDFTKATGLKSPTVGPAYDNFKAMSWDYIQDAGLNALSECFEIWCRVYTVNKETTKPNCYLSNNS